MAADVDADMVCVFSALLEPVGGGNDNRSELITLDGAGIKKGAALKVCSGRMKTSAGATSRR